MKLIDPNTVAGQMQTILNMMTRHVHKVETALDDHLKAGHDDHAALCEAQLCVVEAVSCLADAQAHLTGEPTGQLKAMVKHIRQALDMMNNTTMAGCEVLTVHR